MAVLAAELKLVPVIRAAICSVESRKQVLWENSLVCKKKCSQNLVYTTGKRSQGYRFQLWFLTAHGTMIEVVDDSVDRANF